jgi:hypothetical protein
MVDKRKARRWCGFLIEPYVEKRALLVATPRGNRHQKLFWKLWITGKPNDRGDASWVYVSSIPEAKRHISQYLLEKGE